jgi:hypothetical protein
VRWPAVARRSESLEAAPRGMVGPRAAVPTEIEWCGRRLSLRNVVPTLTSSERQGLSLNGRCQAIKDTRFILVPVGGPYVQQWCARALYCSAPGVPVVGQLQARRERRRGLQVPGEVAEDVVGELGNVRVVCRELFVALVSVVPCGGGVRLPFIGQGEDELHVCRTIQLHGEVWCAAP